MCGDIRDLVCYENARTGAMVRASTLELGYCRRVHSAFPCFGQEQNKNWSRVLAKGFKRWEWYATARASDLSDSAKVVLSAINEHVNEASGKAWPSVATLMRLTGKSESAIHRAMRECRKEGWIITVERPGSTSMNEIALPKGVSLMAPLLKKGGVKSGTPGLSLMAPEPSIEPSTSNHPLPPASAGMDVEGEEKKDQLPVLRPASMKERALWHGVWPDESDLVATNLDTALDAKTALAKEMVWILGYRSADTVEDLQARTEKRVEIQHGLKETTVHTMRMMSAARKLRKADLADWLAINGFAPITKGDADAQAA